jgi:hypothetical protein
MGGEKEEHELKKADRACGWQVIEIAIALSRNMSQICDMHYVKVFASSYCGIIG